MRNLNDKTEIELIALIIEKDSQEALSALVGRYKKPCRRLLYGICAGDLELMDDAEQEVFITLKTALVKFKGESSFSTFFYRIVRNKGIDVVRKNRRRRRDISVSILENSGRDIPSSSSGPEQLLLQKEELRMLWKILYSMKEEDRALIILKDLEGLSLIDIGWIMKKPVGTVKSRLHRARLKSVDIGREVSS